MQFEPARDCTREHRPGEETQHGEREGRAIRQSGERLSFGPVSFRLYVTGRQEQRIGGEGTVLEGTQVSGAEVDSAYAVWKGRAEAQWEAYLEREGKGGAGWAPDSLGAWVQRHPLTVTTRFSNASGPDFSAIFGEEAPRIEGTAADSARLRDPAARPAQAGRRRSPLRPNPARRQ